MGVGMAKDVKARYAIVKVECPPRNEIDAQFVCFPNDNNCSGCRYGDTKEQLIKKVMTAFKIAIKKNKEEKFIKGKSNNRQVAEIVIEFLGVK